MKRLVSMREALQDPQLFGTILPGESWAAWRVVLLANEGEPLTAEERDIYRALSVLISQTVNDQADVAAAAAAGAKAALSSMGPSIVKGATAATGPDTAP